MQILTPGFDHVEFVVRSIDKYAKIFDRLGFEKTGSRELKDQGTRSVVLGQGNVRIVLTEPVAPGALESHADRSQALAFLKALDEGVCVLAVHVDDATKAFQETVARGAMPALEPKRYEAPEGIVVRSEIWTPGKVRYAFIERKKNSSNGPTLLDDRLVVSRLESPAPLKIDRIDHLTNNVSIGEMKNWVEWYKKVFDFHVTRHFDINTGRTGLTSDVVESKCGQVKVPINEATEPESQVQEFVNRLGGPGVQHLALLTNDIMTAVRSMRSHDFKFLTVPHTYYEEVPVRVPGVTESLAELEDLNLLLDGEGGGYLMQIFSEEVMGPFFFEFIQRKGNKGFGEGNFRALFEAIERDQVRRGVLK